MSTEIEWYARRLTEFAQAIDGRLGSATFTILGSYTEPEKTWLARAAHGLALEVLEGRCVPPSGWVDAVRAAERLRIAEELCDCNPQDNPPTNPYTKQRIAHHCDCTTVVLTSEPNEYGVRHDHGCGPQ